MLTGLKQSTDLLKLQDTVRISVLLWEISDWFSMTSSASTQNYNSILNLTNKLNPGFE